MKTNAEGCLVCGKPLIYFEEAKRLYCRICNAEHDTNVTCEEGHFVCDTCHADKGVAFITQYVSNTKSKDPIFIATELMKSPHINMHGPEHHYLIPSALLSAYKNTGGRIDFEKALLTVGQRAKNVPGGICGMWGSCGAGIASGIFISVVTGATPLSELEWSLANLMTSRSLAIISANGGPRCCKRNSYLAITQAVGFVKEHFDIIMELPQRITCEFSHRNNQCRKERCIYNTEV